MHGATALPFGSERVTTVTCSHTYIIHIINITLFLREIVVSHNPLRRQYLKQHATDELYRLYAKTHERRSKAEELKKRKYN